MARRRPRIWHRGDTEISLTSMSGDLRLGFPSTAMPRSHTPKFNVYLCCPLSTLLVL